MHVRAFAVFLSTFTFTLPASAASFILSAFDSIALPGEEVEIQAKVEFDDVLRGNVPFQRVSFELGGESVGSAMTVREGLASLRVTAPTLPGIYPFVATTRGGGFGQGRLVVAAASERLFVTDIDETISDLDSLLIPFTPNDRIHPIVGSVEALHALDAERTIVYLTARDDRFLNKTRAWLALRGYPEGLLVVSDLNIEIASSERQGEYKFDVLQEIKGTWANTDAGAGDKVHDFRAYLSSGMRAYSLGETHRGATLANWNEIARMELAQ